MPSKNIKTGSDFSGVGAFDQALRRLNIEYKTVFACDWDKYARQTYILNFGQPEKYPENVYDREIPAESLDIYMSSPPCQAFSLAGKRKGEADKRGILFYNTHEFISKNKPRYFIIENVKGLLSDDSGRTFQRWLDMLGGKSINGKSIMFAHDESVPYHIHYQVLNAKHYGVPQNRERVFIVGIRDDIDNNFRFPARVPLVKRLRDVLEIEVDEKYYLSDKMTAGLVDNKYINHDTQASQVHDANGVMPTLAAGIHGYALGYVPELNKVAQLKGVHESSGRIYGTDGLSPTITAKQGGGHEPYIQTDDVIQLNPSLESGGKQPYQQNRVYDIKGVCPAISAGQETWKGNIINTQRIRRLTPLECFRLMDFNTDFKWDVSDTQAYKQAGNSIVVGVLAAIIKNLNLPI